MVLELIDEFVFFTKPSLSKSKRLNSIQELQLMQNIIDFFQENSLPSTSNSSVSIEAFEAFNSSAEMLILCNIFTYLFMEPSHRASKGDDCSTTKSSDRMKSLAKLASMSLGLKNRSVLHCLGVWIHRQGPTSDKVIRLCESLIEDHILLVPPDDPHENEQSNNRLALMTSLPVIAPIFVAHFMTAIGELYILDSSPNGKKCPPKVILELINSWLGENNEMDTISDNGADQDDYELGRIFPAMSPTMNSANILFTSPHQYSTQQTLMPLMSLARWAILHTIIEYSGKCNYRDDYARLHSGILECLNDVLERRPLIRADVLSTKKLVLLVSGIQLALDNYETEASFDLSAQQECLDRLGQFLHCVTAAKCVYGKLSEVVSSIKNLPKNRLLTLYIQRYKNS